MAKQSFDTMEGAWRDYYDKTMKGRAAGALLFEHIPREVIECIFMAGGMCALAMIDDGRDCMTLMKEVRDHGQRMAQKGV